MGIQLAKIAAITFAHLPQNQAKVLNWMCLRTLDEADANKGIERAFWYAKWYELAIAINRQVPEDSKKREHLRKEINKICAELVEEGALRPRSNPYRPRENAFDVILDRTAAVPLDQRRRPSKKRKTPVDNSSTDAPRAVQEKLWSGGESPPESEGKSPPVSGGESPPESEGTSPPVSGGKSPPDPNKEEEQAKEQREDVAQEKLDDDTTPRGDHPRPRARPVDNPPADIAFATAFARARAAMGAAPRHARPTPPPIGRPDRE